jgi:uncharacterized membrane protein
MEPAKDELAKRLLDQQVSDPQKRTRYRKEVDAMAEKVRRESWWLARAHAAVIVFFIVQLLLGGGILAFTTYRDILTERPIDAIALAVAWALFFLAAFALLWHLSRRMELCDVAVQIKGLEMRVLDLEEQRDPGN